MCLIIRKWHPGCGHLAAYPIGALVSKKERFVKMERIDDILIGKWHSTAQLVNAVIIGGANDQSTVFIKLTYGCDHIICHIFPYLRIHVRWLIEYVKKQPFRARTAIFLGNLLPGSHYPLSFSLIIIIT